MQEKFEALSREHHTRVSELEVQVHQLRTAAEETVKRIRQLEQTNDDLERTNRCVIFTLKLLRPIQFHGQVNHCFDFLINRATLVSLEDFETRLHSAIERNAFLESELDDKESLAVMVQRLKDETKGTTPN